MTPTKWRIDYNPYDQEYRVYEDRPNGRPITNSMFMGRDAKPDCERIVRAVNSYADLMAACRYTLKELQECRGNVTGLWVRTKEIERRLEAALDAGKE